MRVKRRLFGTLGAVVLLAGFGVATAAPAPAQTPIRCEYEVAAAPVAGGAVLVTLRGFAPGSSVVRIFFDPVPTPPVNPGIVATANSDQETGFFEGSFVTQVSGEATVGVDAYPAVPCRNVPGVAGGNVNQGQIVTGTGTGLPRTGSSSTSTYVRAGLAALAAGMVLVVAGRRRTRIRGRG